MDEIKEIINNLNEEELEQVRFLVEQKISEKKGVYHELTIYSNAYKGTGKAWVQAYSDGKRADFVKPYNVEKIDKYQTEKTYRLTPGTYLVNNEGSKSADNRYKVIIDDNGNLTKESL